MTSEDHPTFSFVQRAAQSISGGDRWVWNCPPIGSPIEFDLPCYKIRGVSQAFLYFGMTLCKARTISRAAICSFFVAQLSAWLQARRSLNAEWLCRIWLFPSIIYSSDKASQNSPHPSQLGVQRLRLPPERGCSGELWGLLTDFYPQDVFCWTSSLVIRPFLLLFWTSSHPLRLFDVVR